MARGGGGGGGVEYLRLNVVRSRTLLKLGACVVAALRKGVALAVRRGARKTLNDISGLLEEEMGGFTRFTKSSRVNLFNYLISTITGVKLERWKVSTTLISIRVFPNM